MSLPDRDQAHRPHVGTDRPEPAAGAEAHAQKERGLEEFLEESRSAISTPEHRKAAASVLAAFTF